MKALETAAERLAETARLLEEAGNVGVWVRSDDAGDNREKRRLLREAGWEAASALRALPETPRLPATRARMTALAEQVEPLWEIVTDTMDVNYDLDSRVMAAQSEAEELAKRLRRNE
jgi:chloramphenicol 3-O-phosphotransferase